LSEPPHATSTVSSATTVMARMARVGDRCMRGFKVGASAAGLAEPQGAQALGPGGGSHRRRAVDRP
jgi:hypothetical protein